MPPTKRRKTEEDETKKATEENSSNDKPSTSKDWRLKNLKERNHYALKQGYLTDVTFSVGPKKTLFHAHKMVLSLATPVFEAMFYGPLREIGERIEITDIVPIGFQLLLDYIYTDDLKFHNESEAFETWIAANKYCLPVAEDLCFKYLSQCKLSNTNVWTMLEQSLLLNSSRLTNRCYRYLEIEIHRAIHCPGFMDISSETLKNILLMNLLFIDEISLLRGVVVWAQYRMLSLREKSLADVLKPFIEYIRFHSISIFEFINFIGDYPDVFSDSDAVKILKYKADNMKYSLPGWCSNNISCRKLEAQMKIIALMPIRKTSVYTLKPHDMENSTHYSSVLQKYPDNELYQDYYLNNSPDLFSDSDVSTSYFDSSPCSNSESSSEEEVSSG